MAVTIDNSYHTHGASVAFKTLPSVVVGSTTNRYMLFVIGIHDSNTANTPVFSVLFGAASATFVCSLQTATQSTRVEIWRLIAPATSTDTVEVDTSGSVNFLSFGVYVLSGVSQVAPEANATAGGNSAAPSLSITNTNANAMLFDVVISEAVPTANASQTTDGTETGQSFQNMAFSHKLLSAAASNTLSYSNSFGAPWNMAAVSIAPVAGAAFTWQSLTSPEQPLFEKMEAVGY